MAPALLIERPIAAVSLQQDAYTKPLVNGTSTKPLLNGISAAKPAHINGKFTAAVNGNATAFAFDTMESALEAFARGEFLVVMDDESRENEGDLIIAADKITTEKMAWMIKHTSGYICIALPESRLQELEIPSMVANNTDRHGTAYMCTVDCKIGTTTGISAHDRASTARALASSTSKPDDFTRPGHMVPLRAREGGILARRGHTESSVDLCMLTGQPLAGVLCEMVNDDEQGTMARRDDCRAFADRWGIKMISVDQLVKWRRDHE